MNIIDMALEITACKWSGNTQIAFVSKGLRV